MSVRVRWLSSGQRSEAGDAWQRIEAELGGARLACSWAWTETWLEHYGDAVRHRFAVLEAGGRPRGIVLITCSERQRGGVRLRTLHLGTAGEPHGTTAYVQYNGLLVDPAVRREAAQALMASLDALRWHDLRLDGFVAQDADLLLGLRAGAQSERRTCRTLSLPADPEAVVEAFSPSVRKVLRRGVRRLPGLEVASATSVTQALEMLEELKVLSDARWDAEEREGAFAQPRFVAFHRALLTRLVPDGRALMARVRDADGTVGCGYVLVDGTTALAYQIGRRLETDNRVSTGQVVELLLMQASAAEGLAAYSHQSGDTEHKRRLSSGSEELVWASWHRGRALGLRRARAVAELVVTRFR